MGPLESIGPYAETTITTRKSDVAGTDNRYGLFDAFIGIIIIGVTLPVVMFLGLLVWAHIGPVCLIGLVVLGFWTCARYGTNNRLLKCRRKSRLSDDNRKRIERRLSDTKENEKS